MTEYAVTVDLGKKHDRTVFMVLKDHVDIAPGATLAGQADRLQHTCQVPFIDQFSGVDYPTIVEHLATLMATRELSNNADLLIDGRSMGEPVADMLVQAGLSPISIVATAGQEVHPVYSDFGKVFEQKGQAKFTGIRPVTQYNVPKADLVEAGKKLMHTNRLMVARGLRWAEEFQRQLQHFKGVATQGGHRTYQADDEDIRDDIVFCYLMGAWWFIYTRKDAIIPSGPAAGDSAPDWDPLDFA